MNVKATPFKIGSKSRYHLNSAVVRVLICLPVGPFSIGVSIPTMAMEVNCANAGMAEAGAAASEQDVIIVTGEKLGRTSQETSSSVAIFTGEELEDRSIQDLYDVVGRTPNVMQSFGEKGFAIRGIDQRFGAGAGLLVATVIDGASLPNDRSTFFGPYSAWDISQIEILRGPQGTTQGRNAVGGAIIINTAAPKLDTLEAKGRVSFGELGSQQFAGAVNAPFGDRIAARISVDRRKNDGWVFNPVRNEEFDRRDFINIRGKLLVEPSDRFSASYGVNYTDNEGGEDLIEYPLFPDSRINNSNGPGIEGSEHQIHTLRLAAALSETLSLTSVSTYYRHDYSRLQDLDGQPIDAGLIDRTQKDRNYQQETLLNLEGKSGFRGVIGTFFGRYEADVVDSRSVPTSLVNPQLPGGLAFQDRDITNVEENYALFGEFEVEVSDALGLIAGGRYDVESRDTTILSRTRAIADNPAFQDFLDQVVAQLAPDELIVTTAKYSALLPKIGLRYKFDETTYLGFTLQRAYRAGGTSTSAITQTLSEYDPEYTWTYEASLRSSLAGGKVHVAANLFYTDWRNQIVNLIIDPNFPQDFIAVNAGSSRLMGAELQLEAQPVRDLTLFAGLGLLDTRFTDYESNNIEFTGNEFAYAPGHSVTAGLDYRHTSGFRFVADLNHTGGHFSSTSNDPLLTMQINGQEFCTRNPCNDPRTLIPSYMIVNAKVGYEMDRLSIFAVARNLFDESYVTQLNANGTARSGAPRFLGIELNFQI